MNFTKLSIAVIALAVLTACDPAKNMNAGTSPANINSAPTEQNLSEVPRPPGIVDMVKNRGDQDDAKPTMKIVEPKADATLASSTVKVKLELAGTLKGYQPMKDVTTGTGNHIHVILDNQPYEVFYNLDSVFELRNVADGEHTLRVFPSRPWHESYKNEGAFQMVKFTVKNGGGDSNKLATTNSSDTVANSSPGSTRMPEGKDMPPSTAGKVDMQKPLLTYSRPQREYKGANTVAIMIDFWLINAKLKDAGGDYRVKYSVDGGEANFLDKWEPIWLTGWSAGKHRVKLELVDKNGNLVENGGYNSTEREIKITQ